LEYTNEKEICLEFVIVVNSETDGNIDVLLHLSSSIKIFRNLTNLGFSKAINVGIKNSTFNNLLILNSDVQFFEQGTILKCLTQLECLDNKVILTPRLLNYPLGPEQVSYGNFPSLFFEVIMTLRIHKILGEKWMYKKGFLFERNKNKIVDGYVVATALFLSKTALLKLQDSKLYDDMFLYGEELFWGKAWSSNDIKGYYFSGAQIMHSVGGSEQKKGDEKLYQRRLYQTEGENLFLTKYFSRFKVSLIYFLRLFRWSLLLGFRKDKDLSLRKKVLLEVLRKKTNE